MKLSKVLFVFLFLSQASFADGPERFEISISKNRVSPADTVVSSKNSIELIVHNKGKSQAVFRSGSLNREVIIAPNQSASISLGTLRSGAYYFSGEFKSGSAQGRILVK